MREDDRWDGPEVDELVRRLRSLEWAQIDPGMKERCWREFRQRVADEGAPARARREDSAHRWEFTGRRLSARGLGAGARLETAQRPTRRLSTRGLVASERLAAAGGWTRGARLARPAGAW